MIFCLHFSLRKRKEKKNRIKLRKYAFEMHSPKLHMPPQKKKNTQKNMSARCRLIRVAAAATATTEANMEAVFFVIFFFFAANGK